ncbi:hypothetical protein ABPG72_016717 [Tetrahymena utriculariae]
MEDQVSEEIQRENQTNIQIPKTQCRSHRTIQADYILLLGCGEFLFFCENCIESYRDRGEFSVLSLKDLYQQTKSFIIKEWPPVNNYKLYDELRQEVNEVIDQDLIEKVFQDLQEKLLETIKNKKNEEIEKAKKLKIYQSELMESYHSFAQLEELKNYINTYLSTKDKQSKINIVEYMRQTEEGINQNTKQLEDILNQYKQIKPRFEISRLNDFCDNIIKKTQNFSLINCQKDVSNKECSELQLLINQLLCNKTNFVTQQFLSQFNQAYEEAEYIFKSTIDANSVLQQSKKPIPFHQLKEEDFQMVLNYTTKLLKPEKNALPSLNQTKEIMNLISNKFNFLNHEFLQELQTILLSVEPIFSNLNVSSNRIFKPGFNPKNLNPLSERAASNIYQLCQKISSNFSFNIAKNELSYKVYQNLSPLCQNKEKLKNLLFDYPIFEFLEKDEIYENGIMPQIYGSLEKCRYNDSHKIEFIQKHCQKIQIQSLSRAFAGAYFKYEMKAGKKYVVRFQFDELIRNFIIIGLLPKESAPSIQLANTFLGKVIGIQSKNYCSEVVRGSQLNLLMNLNQILEMRIDISQNVLEFSDYPDQKNINKLENSYTLNPQTEYYLGVQFGNNENNFTKISLVYFNEVEEFEPYKHSFLYQQIQ